MHALIVGADRIDTLREEIARVADHFSITGLEHWSGRKTGDACRPLPSRTGLVIVVCNRSNHMLVKNVRSQANRRGIPLVYCRHSALEVRERLSDLCIQQTRVSH